MNYFELFDIEKKYEIDLASLKKNYLHKQSKIHSDVTKIHADNMQLTDSSMHINQAYKILLDPYSRAVYLLEITGIKITDENSKNLLSTDTLENIWELNQQLQDANNIDELFKLEQEQLNIKAQIMSDLQKLFQESKFYNALELTVKLKYLTNLIKNIRLKIKDANS